uniref:Uncharacterized mitochondrial protein AtMg00810-like n=1 Tax=Tanacetum cinerariifolium TaxID=118510 RepID=A0A6L2LMX4_TANCI|nr:uncharacterized mitochondrial protein AtMg00810-like [Tanacetum cinerariifolium]
MDQDSAHIVGASKVPMLKPGEFEIWRMRIEEYILMIDYAPWEVIKNGATLPKTQVVKGVTTVMLITTVKEKAQRRLELLKAVENRFGRNAATKITQMNLLKQQYENFTALSSEMLDQTFYRLQKLMNLRWKMAMLTMRARRFLKRIRRNLTVSRNETISFDKSNMEYYNCHKREHFARECRALRNQDNKHKESSRRTVHMKTSNSIALVSCDGLGGDDWSDQEEEGPSYALMTFSSLSSNSKVSNDSTCLKSCLETVKLFKSQNEQLSKDLNKLELMVLGYKTSLVSVEERLKFYKTNKSIYLEDIKVLKVKLQMGEIAIKELRKKLKIAQKEKDGIQLNVKKFENASKNLNKLIECQIVDNCKKRLGFENYNVVPPPYTGNFMPPTPDLSFTGLDEFLISLKLRIIKAKSSEEETKVWKPKTKVLDHVSKHNTASITLKKFDYVDAQGKSKFTWVFFLATKDETSSILKSFITKIENLVDHKVKVIRCDNVTEFKNTEMNQFCKMKEAVNTACYVQNRVLVVKPHNKTPYEFFHGRTPTLSFMRPFGCFVTILNTIDQLGKYDCKADEGFFVGYSLNSKSFRVFNSRIRIVEENLHIRLSESTPNVVGSGPDWLFDIDALTRTMNYEPIVAGTQSNDYVGTKASDNAGQSRKETELVKDYIFLPLCTVDPPISQNSKSSYDDASKPSSDDEKNVDDDPRKENECKHQEKEDNVNSSNNVNTVSSTVNVAGTNEDNELPLVSNMPALEDVSIFNFSSDDEDDGFEDPDFSDRVYKVKKALYGLHQAHRAWYETLSTYLLDYGFQRGKIDKTLFIKRHKGNILLVQVYVDDIIFGSTKNKLCNTSERLMHEKFQMSSIEELTFSLGLEVEQKKDGIFISQDKYVAEILKKFGFTEVNTASTPMETQKLLLKDEDGEEVDVRIYRSMIGSLMYLTSLRPDIMFVVCACARYQVNLKVSHLHAMKRVFRYLKGQPKLGLWYPKDSPFDLVAYTDSDYARASLDRKSTTGGCQFFRYGKKIIVNESSVRRDLRLADEVGKGSAMPTDPHHTPTILQPSSSKPQKTQKSMKPKRKDTRVPHPSGLTESVADEAVHKALGDSLVRVATTASSLEVEQDSGGPRCQEAIGDTTAQTRFESVSKHSNDSLLARGSTFQSDKDRLKLNELMALCTNLQTIVLELEKTKTTQSNEISYLKMRVKKLEKKNMSRTHNLKRLYKVGLTARVESSRDEESLGEDASKHRRRIDAINQDEDITMINVQDDSEMFDVNDLGGEEVFVTEQEVVKDVNENVVEEVVNVAQDSTATTAITTKELTLAQALKALKTSKPKVKGIVIQEQEEPEPVKHKKKDQIRLDEETAKMLQAKFDKEERLAKKRDQKEQEANIALIETYNYIQAKIDADHQLAKRLQEQEQEDLSDVEKATLFQQLLEKRRKHFAANRVEEKMNKPTTQAQRRKIMYNYLKNMEGYTLK